MKIRILTLVFISVCSLCLFAGDRQNSPAGGYLFTYFTGNGEDGLHLAWSRDGLQWQAVNAGRTLLYPLVGETVLMRDPCLTQGPDGTYHMVWTTSWTGRTIGYASSSDLLHWSKQKAIPVMADEPKALNCWAPEILYLPESKEFLLYWSTTITDRFPETFDSTKSKEKRNHRIYYTVTGDFRNFTPSRLLYDPGFNCIDASIYRDDNRYFLLLKDETELPRAQKNIRIAWADSATGPYGKSSEPISGNYWAEGPTALKIGDRWHLYFDKYRDHTYGLLTSTDLKTWEDRSDQLQVPQGLRHGTVFSVSRERLESVIRYDRTPEMMFRDESRKGRPYAKDPSVVKFQGKYFLYYSLPPKEEKGEAIGGWSIGIAVSGDLTQWKKVGEILPEHPYEAKGLCAPGARVMGGEIHLFYQTYGNREKDAICHARSSDGLHFRKNETNPIFSPTGGWNIGRAIDAEVVLANDTAYLYWATRDPSFEKQMIGLATAPIAQGFDRGSWTQIGSGPRLRPELTWEKNCIEGASVAILDGRWLMFYAGAYNSEGQQIGLATSRDGIRWERYSTFPVLPYGEENAWNAAESGHPGLFVDDDGTVWLFFQGNPDQGYTYYLSKKRVEWKDNILSLK